MLNKFLKEIVISIAGKQAEGMIDLIYGKKYVNEFLIAKKLNLTINQIRNILYKISDYGLVSFIRKKDKKKGWYTYFWKIEVSKSLEFLKENLLRKMEIVQNQLNTRKTKEFYTCEGCKIEFTEDTALVYNFMCNECGEIMTRKDNSALIREYTRELDKLKKEMNLIEDELVIERQKLDKIREREKKKEEKLKAEEKQRKKLARAGKKVVKKTKTSKDKIKTKKTPHKK